MSVIKGISELKAMSELVRDLEKFIDRDAQLPEGELIQRFADIQRKLNLSWHLSCEAEVDAQMRAEVEDEVLSRWVPNYVQMFSLGDSCVGCGPVFTKNNGPCWLQLSGMRIHADELIDELSLGNGISAHELGLEMLYAFAQDRLNLAWHCLCFESDAWQMPQEEYERLSYIVPNYSGDFKLMPLWG